ncbi:MAG: DUF5667 domain-containing protein, partial [Candidatus Promineifilaceae bacterium]
MKKALERLRNENLRRTLVRLVEAGWMKVTLLLLSATIIIIVVLAGGVVLLADAHPFAPDHPLYNLQFAAESISLELTFNDAKQAEKALLFAERRLEELEQAPQGEDLGTYAARLDADLSLAVRLIFGLPLEDRGELIDSLTLFTRQAQQVLADMPGQSDAITALLDKLTELLAATSPAEIMAVADPEAAARDRIEAENVLFIGDDFDHSFYPLTGAHAETECVNCHLDGQYAGTSGECLACHLSPADHYVGECVACHATTAWADVTFDHTGLADCGSCHLEDAPPQHYPGQCSTCHVPQNWTEIAFDHAGFDDCVSCHASAAPPFHYQGQCSNCHVSQDWSLVTFNHTGFTDCAGC